MAGSLTWLPVAPCYGQAAGWPFRVKLTLGWQRGVKFCKGAPANVAWNPAVQDTGKGLAVLRAAVNDCKDAIVKKLGNTSANPFTAYYRLPTPGGMCAGQFENGMQQCLKCF
ncbi:hypothetical protein [Herbaspirillum camelliae]|uniref:hypothetical protein n=1 Tax=Herbaspirillum camelliae TaxID=1892903 RepID=UPI00117A38F4|nr:hypothetical protein [Herbaspirillum camelliae]